MAVIPNEAVMGHAPEISLWAGDDAYSIVVDLPNWRFIEPVHVLRSTRSSGLPDVAFASVAWQLCMQAKSGVQREGTRRIQKSNMVFSLARSNPRGVITAGPRFSRIPACYFLNPIDLRAFDCS